MIERIKEILRVNRLTQKIFCEETGMSKTRLSALLNGKVMGISKPILKAIELKYNINPEWLLKG